MEMLMGWLRAIHHREEGQALTEYVLILILIAVVVILLLTVLGVTINNTYSTVNSTLPHT